MKRDEYAATADKHREKMVNRAALYVGDRDAAADLVAHAIEKGLRNCSGLSRASFELYMFDAVRHVCLDHMELRRHKVEQSPDVDQDGSPLQEPASHPNDDLRLDIEKAIHALPVSLRSVAIKLYCDDWTQVEIAELMRCTQKHVSTLVTKINRHLSTTLADYKTGRIGTCATKSQ